MKSAHCITVNDKWSMDKIANVYLKEIARLHGVSLMILSHRDSHFMSRFWTSLQKEMGTKLCLSTTYHPQTDGQSERTIQTLERYVESMYPRIPKVTGTSIYP